MKFVLDSSAFLSGKNLVTDKIECCTTYSVINELESKQMKGTVYSACYGKRQSVFLTSLEKPKAFPEKPKFFLTTFYVEIHVTEQ